MSATLIPTKTAGARPPILPPVNTTFDGAPDGGDSWLVYLQEDVRLVCQHADAAAAESLEVMINLLDGRKRLVVAEIWAYLALQDYPVPPIADFPIDYLIGNSTREERILAGLVSKIDDCRARCERRLARHRFELRLKQDLGTSDS